VTARALQTRVHMHGPQSERHRLLEKLLRELVRSEDQAVEHVPREAKRIGEMPPVIALRDVAVHALAMRPRFTQVLDGHELVTGRGGISATLSTLRHLVTDRIHDAERAYRAALLDLRHGVDVVRVLREVARLEELFALIRWCDDWLPARRTLIARVEAQLGWFADQAFLDPDPSHTSTSEDSNEPELEDPSAWFDRP
jgi:hypothetical protein